MTEEEIARAFYEFATCTDISKGPAALDKNATTFAKRVLAIVQPAIDAAVAAERERGLRRQTTALAQAQDFRRLWEETQREAIGALQHAEQFLMSIGHGDGTDGARIRRSIAAIRARSQESETAAQG